MAKLIILYKTRKNFANKSLLKKTDKRKKPTKRTKR